ARRGVPVARRGQGARGFGPAQGDAGVARDGPVTPMGGIVMRHLRGPGTVWLAALAIAVVALPAASQQAAHRGGAVTIALYQEPELLNPYLATQTASFEVAVLTVEGLVAANEKGEYFPQLATEVPSPANGGVSQDGKTITYRLRPGLAWSDGRPLTCDDVKFTWEAIVTPKSGAVTTSGYDESQ